MLWRGTWLPEAAGTWPLDERLFSSLLSSLLFLFNLLTMSALIILLLRMSCWDGWMYSSAAEVDPYFDMSIGLKACNSLSSLSPPTGCRSRLIGLKPSSMPICWSSIGCCSSSTSSTSSLPYPLSFWLFCSWDSYSSANSSPYWSSGWYETSRFSLFWVIISRRYIS